MRELKINVDYKYILLQAGQYCTILLYNIEKRNNNMIYFYMIIS